MHLKKFLFCLIILSFSLLNNSSVKAYTLTKEFSGYYYERNNEAGNNYYAGTLKEFSLNDKVAYCIEPGVDSGTDEYSPEKWEHSNLDSDIQNDIALYAYYGYDYPQHQTLKYRAATQALIWERILNDKSTVTYSEGEKGTGRAIDISTERDVITNLVKRHNLKPSFDTKTYQKAIGEVVKIEDKNNILSEYEIVSVSNESTAEIKGNFLEVTTKNKGTTTINLRKKKKYPSSFNVFYSEKYQDIIVAGEVETITSFVKINAKGGKIIVEKLDNDNLTNKAQGEGTLKGAEYGIYNDNNDLIEKIVTNTNGIAESKDNIPLGNYYIKELKASLGYELDKTKYEIEIESAKTYTIQVTEKIIKRKFLFIKVINLNQTGEMDPEVGIEFGVFDALGNLISKATSNAEGKFEFELPYGQYVLKQLSVNDKYEKLSDYHFEVKSKGEETKILADKAIMARLKVIKIDAETGKNIPIAGIKFKIYDIEKEKYVSQILSYPEQKNIDTFETDNNGVILTPMPLEPGTYYLEEVDQKIPGYLWNEEKIKFTIDKNSALVDIPDYGKVLTIKFGNYSVKGNVKVLKVGKYLASDNGKIISKEVPLEGVLFGLYALEDIYSSWGEKIYNKNDLIMESLTNKDGLLEFSNLWLGKYYLKELKTIDNYVLDSKKYEIELNYLDQYTNIVYKELTVNNQAFSGTLKFLKIDGDTKEPLSGIIMEIYDLNNNLIYVGITNKDGQINVDLPLGKYYLKEKKTLEKYALNEDKIFFEITLDKEIISCTLKNYKIPEPKIVVEVPDTYIESKTRYYIGLPLLFGLLYVKKKRKL